MPRGNTDAASVKAPQDTPQASGRALMSRRTFLWVTGTAGLGLAVGVGLGAPRALRFIRNRRPAPPLGAEGWVEISPEGDVRVRCNATEMGQGAWSALAQLVTEELEADWSRVSVAMAPVERPFNGPRNYGTGGSYTVRSQFDTMRRIGAAARVLLVEAAARRWGVGATECFARAGRITHTPTGRSLGFGEVAADAATLSPPTDPPLKAREAWQVIGRSLPRAEVPSKIDGTALFGPDIRMPGLRFATIAHCPVPGGSLRAVDDTPARAVAGVEDVMKLADAVVVVANATWPAFQGLKQLDPQWDPGANARDSSEGAHAALLAAVEGGTAKPVAEGSEAKQSAEKASGLFTAAASRLSATYRVPLLAHAQLEPMNATAWFHDGVLEIWAPTQKQAILRQEIAKALSLPIEKVRIHTPLVGGGFGRRLQNDYAIEAARVAHASKHPVQVLWTREEDFRRGIFRPSAAARLQAAFGSSGELLAMRSDVASLGEGTRMEGLEVPPYRLPAYAAHHAAVLSGIRTGSWRSVDLSENAFFLESFIDECALHARRDPLDFRLALLAAGSRERRVLEAVAELAGWRTRAAGGRHLGLAFCAGFGSFCALVAEAFVEAGRVRIGRYFAATDCGTAVNPRGVVAQVEGAIVMALSAALAEEITVKEGRVVETGYGSYPILPIGLSPEIVVRVLDTPGARVGGVGELAVPPTAPAAANAVHAATGIRVRSLPLWKDPQVKWHGAP